MNSKAYLIYTSGKSVNESYVLVDVSRDDFMGIACIKGIYRHPSATAHWMIGQVVYLPVERIANVTEYESYDAYKVAIKRYYEDQTKQRDSKLEGP